MVLYYCSDNGHTDHSMRHFDTHEFMNQLVFKYPGKYMDMEETMYYKRQSISCVCERS